MVPAEGRWQLYQGFRCAVAGQVDVLLVCYHPSPFPFPCSTRGLYCQGRSDRIVMNCMSCFLSEYSLNHEVNTIMIFMALAFAATAGRRHAGLRRRAAVTTKLKDPTD